MDFSKYVTILKGLSNDLEGTKVAGGCLYTDLFLIKMIYGYEETPVRHTL